MKNIYLSECSDVFYLEDKNVVLVHWKKYCELEQYRKPLEAALQMRDKTGLSHGTICAARKELVDAGLLTLGKDGRRTTYLLTSQADQSTGMLRSFTEPTSPPQGSA